MVSSAYSMNGVGTEHAWPAPPMRHFQREARALGREIADALWSASALRTRGLLEGVAFVVAGALLASRLLVVDGALDEQLRLPSTVLAVLLPFSIVLRTTSFVLGSPDARSSRADDVAVALMSVVLGVATLEPLLGVELYAGTRFAGSLLAVLLGASGAVALALVARSIVVEAAQRRWSKARIRDVARRELPLRFGPILLAPVLAASEPALGWLAALGLVLQGGASLAGAGRARARALI